MVTCPYCASLEISWIGNAAERNRCRCRRCNQEFRVHDLHEVQPEKKVRS